MQRRITFSIVDTNNDINNQKAVQPKTDDLAQKLLAVITADLKQDENDHDGMTVIRVSVEKEVISGAADTFQADHVGARILDHPQKMAVKEAAIGDEATLPRKSDRRLVKLIVTILKRIDMLLYSCFGKELFTKWGGEVGKLLGKKTTWILLALLLWYLIDHRFSMTLTLSQLFKAVLRLIVSTSL